MKISKIIITTLGFIISNFLYAAFSNHNWHDAFEHSYFQFGLLIGIIILAFIDGELKIITPNKEQR